MDLLISRDDAAGSQQIPETVLEKAELKGTERLLVHADKGYILIRKNDMAVKEQIELIASLREGTVREKLWDGRFSQINKEWARGQKVPPDPDHNCDFVVESHPAVLDGFLREVRAEFQKMNLFEAKHCCPDPPDAQDFAGKILVVSPYSLLERYWSQENQLWYAHDGLGCNPYATGEFIRATCLGDGEETFWHREDFIGVLKDELLGIVPLGHLLPFVADYRKENF